MQVSGIATHSRFRQAGGSRHPMPSARDRVAGDLRHVEFHFPLQRPMPLQGKVEHGMATDTCKVAFALGYVWCLLARGSGAHV